ncbi:MAG: DUF4922 domain-containing protein [Coprobacter sp.]|nr:DUF4922 domain-containing protein [Coprobacter sp.]
MNDLPLLTPHAEALFLRQKTEWQLLADNYRALDDVLTRTLDVAGIPVRLQCNPSRIRSTASCVDVTAIAERPCFLCDKNRPPEQLSIPIGERYKLLVNPYPIFPIHFTIMSVSHVPQTLSVSDERSYTRFLDMLSIARALPGYVVFYNGARSGASAPDHMHFQAGKCGIMPMETNWDALMATCGNTYRYSDEVRLSWLTHGVAIVAIDGNNPLKLYETFSHIMSYLPLSQGEAEPSVNALCTVRPEGWRCWVVARSAHRPWQYTATGEASRLVSPGAVDMMGLIITPRRDDYDRLTADEIADIYHQVASPSLLIKEICTR